MLHLTPRGSRPTWKLSTLEQPPLEEGDPLVDGFYLFFTFAGY